MSTFTSGTGPFPWTGTGDRFPESQSKGEGKDRGDKQGRTPTWWGGPVAQGLLMDLGVYTPAKPDPQKQQKNLTTGMILHGSWRKSYQQATGEAYKG